MKRPVSMCLFVLLIVAVILSLALSAVPAGAVEKWKVQSYTLLPHEKWTPGCNKGYNEGDFVPHRLVLKDFVAGAQYQVSFWDDYSWKGKGNPYGFDYSNSFAVVGGTLDSVVDEGFVNAQHAVKHEYTITFTPDGTLEEVIVSWTGHLAITVHGKKGASYWPGASLDTRIQWKDPVLPGERTLPHQVGRMRDIPTVDLKIIKLYSFNKQYDITDPLLGPDWQFNLYDLDGNLFDWGVTDENSELNFVNLLKDSYVKPVEVQQAGWVLDFPALGYYELILVDPVTTVYFGNFNLVRLKAFKFYDINLNGIWDPGEPIIAGIKFTYVGTDCYGNPVNLEATSGVDGADFGLQYPGSGVLSVIEPSGSWIPTTPTSVNVTLGREDVEFGFGNVCTDVVGFNTKGYWHNKNGLDETSLGDLAYLNSLAPWLAPSSYFEAGDEPIDGYFQDGTPVAAATGILGELLAKQGTPWAEQSHFLVDANSGGNPREQLAQQGDAFVMNVLHRLGGISTPFWVPGTGWVIASDLINDFCEIWATGSSSQQNTMASLLDSLNNSTAVEYVCPEPCPVIYP